MLKTLSIYTVSKCSKFLKFATICYYAGNMWIIPDHLHCFNVLKINKLI